MPLPQTERRMRSLLAVGVVALIFAIFVWGTGYKLSLYRETSPSAPPVQPAKLLSPQERLVCGSRSAATPSPLKARVSRLAFVALLLLVSLRADLHLKVARWRIGTCSRLKGVRSRAIAYLAFHPPPAASLLP